MSNDLVNMLKSIKEDLLEIKAKQANFEKLESLVNNINKRVSFATSKLEEEGHFAETEEEKEVYKQKNLEKGKEVTKGYIEDGILNVIDLKKYLQHLESFNANDNKEFKSLVKKTKSVLEAAETYLSTIFEKEDESEVLSNVLKMPNGKSRDTMIKALVDSVDTDVTNSRDYGVSLRHLKKNYENLKSNSLFEDTHEAFEMAKDNTDSTIGERIVHGVLRATLEEDEDKRENALKIFKKANLKLSTANLDDLPNMLEEILKPKEEIQEAENVVTEDSQTSEKTIDPEIKKAGEAISKNIAKREAEVHVSTNQVNEAPQKKVNPVR